MPASQATASTAAAVPATGLGPRSKGDSPTTAAVSATATPSARPAVMANGRSQNVS